MAMGEVEVRGLHARAAHADIPSMNVYDVFRVSGELDEVEAEFYERVCDAWVFYAGGEEVFRVSIAEVAGITKSPIETNRD